MQIGKCAEIGLLAIAVVGSFGYSQSVRTHVAVEAQHEGARVMAASDSHMESSPLFVIGPGALAAHSADNVYLAVHDGVFKTDLSGVYTRIAGTERNWPYSGDSGPAIRAGLNASGVSLDREGNLYVADAGNNHIRRIAAATGVITTVAGNGVKGFSGDGGQAADAQFNGPTGVAVDTAGNLYIADGTGGGAHRIRLVQAATGIITTVAGNGLSGDSGDGGPAILAQFNFLGGLATDASGNLYIADNFNNRIRMVSAANGIVTTVAGTGVSGHSGDGGLAANAELNNPLGIAVDGAGNLYIADSGNYRIREVTLASGKIGTVHSENVDYQDVQHGFPCALAVDGAGNIYVADSGVARIRKIAAGSASEFGREADGLPRQSLAATTGFKINVTYDSSVPTAAQTAFNSVVSTYQSVFTSNITVNINVAFGNTGLGESLTQEQGVTYTAWRTAMIAKRELQPRQHSGCCGGGQPSSQ